MYSLRVLVVFLMAACGVKAQTFEFTENKGQWNQEVRFKGELSSGAFFLKNNGYRVLQYDTAMYATALAKASGHYTGAIAGTTGPEKNGTRTKVAEHAAVDDSDERLVINTHAYDVSFAGANPSPQIVAEQALTGYSNYFVSNDKTKWASKVKTYGALVYKNIYPGIDARYYSENGYVKYDLIIQPNAATERIALQYDGVEGLSIDNGDLIVKTSVTTIREQYPLSYQLVNGKRQLVKCKYELYGNKVRFKLSDYDRSQPLIIDPTLIFCSFFGSPAQTWGYTATYDNAGNLYGGGIVLGNNYPATTGAYQTVWAGGTNTGEGSPFDIGIMKFSPTGARRIYSTYIGGAKGNEQPHSLVVDKNGDLVIAGRTTSDDYPTTRAVIGRGGQWDIVVSRLSADGSSMIGSVRMGDQENDGVNIRHKYGGAAGPLSLMRNYGDDSRSEVIIDPKGDICIASCTQSPNFPVTANAFQRAKGALQDGLLIKFNANLSTLLFSSFIGGSQDDAAYVLGIAPDGNIYVGGGTCSLDFPGNKSGTVGPAFNQGVADGFIAVVSSDGSALLKSTYIGTVGIDQVYGIQFDRAGFFYLQGTSTGNFPVINAAFSQAGGKQFVAKLPADLSRYIYSTVWGTSSVNPNISPVAFLVDRCENVYVSGWGGVINASAPYAIAGTTGLTTTPDAIKSNTDGNDFYFFVLEKDAKNVLFASFFGQQDPTKVSDHVDGGTSRFDQDGIIYQAMCANCGGGQFPITPGVVGPSNPSGSCNVAVVKVAFNLSGVRGGVKAAINGVDGDTTACVPVTVVFRDTVQLAASYEWTFADGSPMVKTTTANISHTFSTVGNYRVMMVAVDSSKCYPRDTTYVTIRVLATRANLAAKAVKLPPCESNAFEFQNLSAAPAGLPFQNNSFTWVFGDNSAPQTVGANTITHTYPGAGTYNARLILTDTNYCNAPDTLPLVLRVSPNVSARFQTPLSGCAPYQAVFNNVSLGGTNFLWTFGDGTTSTEVSPTKLYSQTGTYTVKLVAEDSNSCNKIDSTTISIVVSGSPTAAFSFSPNPPEENIITTFTNQSQGAVRYNWKFGDGGTLQTVRIDTVVKHQYKKTGSYNACLIAYNQYNCPDSVCQDVPIIINALLDVVTAFTPNGDGVNDRAIVIGYGIEKMTFRIFNRWGQMVFQSTDPDIGWDGKFKGRAQPMDGYGYTLDAVMFGGAQVRKSGSITLVR